MSAAIYRLSTANLHALAASLRSGPLSLGLSKHSVLQIAGSSTDDVLEYLRRLSEAGMSPFQTALVVDAIGETRNASTEPEQAIDLILSGPELLGVPLSDTIATVRTLVAEATRELVLVGYAVHNAKPIFEPLALRMANQKALRVIFCLDIPRRHGDEALISNFRASGLSQQAYARSAKISFSTLKYGLKKLGSDPAK